MGITERKEREKLQRRNDIIDAAEKVFFDKGVENATMDDIAEAAEYSKGTLYLYFKNKEEIQYAIKMRASELLKERFSKVFNKGISGLENVVNIGRAFIQYSRDYPDHFNLMMHFEGKNLDNINFEDPHIKKFFEEESPMILFMDIVKKGQEDGSLRDDIDPGILAHNLWAMTTGVLQLLTRQNQLLEMTGFENMKDQFIEGMFLMFRKGIIKPAK